MAFVHSLARANLNGKPAWCAPVELGESAPHYVSFVVPVDDEGMFFLQIRMRDSLEGSKRLYDEEDAFIVGSEPFAHYKGIKRIAKAMALREGRVGK